MMVGLVNEAVLATPLPQVVENRRSLPKDLMELAEILAI